MTPPQILVLGLVQGITEFLPISSSGHLVLASRLLGWPDQGLHFDMAAHVGTWVALVVYFRREVAELGGGAWTLLRRRSLATAAARDAWWLGIATLPVGVAGLLFAGGVERWTRSPTIIATTSIVFGLLLGVGDRLGRGREPSSAEAALAGLGWGGALWLGGAQALALIPGTSRAGVVMTAALFLGTSRSGAARISMLLALPVGLLVGVKDVWDLASDPASANWLEAAAGFLIAGVAAFVAIDALLRWARRQGYLVFAVYRVLLGAALLALVR